MNGVMLVAACMLAAEPAAAGPPASAAADEIVARVDGVPISTREVEREMAIALGDRAITPEARRSIWEAARDQLIDRRLVQRWLTETNQSATAAEVERARQQLVERLQQRGSTLGDFLREQKLDEEGLNRSLAWQIAWGRLLDKQQTDTNLEKYFQRHRRDFDGTEVRVAHIVWKMPQPRDPADIEGLRKKAQQIAESIRRKSLTFADAARAHSQSPSAENGGEIGWIRRREPMPEPFSRVAFSLEPLQVSEPVETAVGIHLIQCLEIRPGQQRWQDVRAELEQAVTKYLFEWAADQVRPRARIERTLTPAPSKTPAPTAEKAE